MTRVLIPGSFDPLTNGHYDLILRACDIFEEVTVGIVVNPNKMGLFSITEREQLITQAFKEVSHPPTVTTFSGLLVNYVADHNYDAIVKGLRSAQDFSYELPMDHMNVYLRQIRTLYLATAPQWTFVSSSLVKEVAKLGGDITGLVPDNVQIALQHKFHSIEHIEH